MPLSIAKERHEIHHRVIDMVAYERVDGLYDVEAHLVDCKPFEFKRVGAAEPVPAGEPLHDLWVRITIDGGYKVVLIEAASDVTPHAICKGAEETLQVMVGETIGKGWSSKVRERLRGVASCTHLMEMLLPLATTALQGLRGLRKLPGASVDANGVPLLLNSCYAFDETREVVRMLWPDHHRADEH